jgi:hypothetical protein
LWRVRRSRPFIHRCCAHEKIVDVEAFQRHRKKPNCAHHRSAPANPIVHRESGEPFILFRQFIYLASDAGYSHGVRGELETFFSKFRFSLEHSISRFLCPTGFGNHNDERLRKIVVDLVENAVETVRIGVVEEIDIHWIAP